MLMMVVSIVVMGGDDDDSVDVTMLRMMLIGYTVGGTPLMICLILR